MTANISTPILAATIADGPDAGLMLGAYRIDPSGAVTYIPTAPDDVPTEDANGIILGAIAADWDVHPVEIIDNMGGTPDVWSGQDGNTVLVVAHGDDAYPVNPAAETLIGVLGMADHAVEGAHVHGPAWVLYGPQDADRLAAFPATLAAFVAATLEPFATTTPAPTAAELLSEGALSLAALRASQAEQDDPAEWEDALIGDPMPMGEGPDLAALLDALGVDIYAVGPDGITGGPVFDDRS